MKVLYRSEKLSKFFDTEKECLEAEKEFDSKQLEKEKQAELERKRQEDLKATRKARAEDVDKAFNDANEKLNKFLKDYGTFHTKFEFREPNPFDIFDKFWF